MKIRYDKAPEPADRGRAGGVSFAGLLQILFLGLKLGEIGPVADWSWWWVLSPAWGTIALVVGLFLTIMVAAAGLAVCKWLLTLADRPKA